MNKLEFIAEVSNRCGITKSDVENILNTAIDVATDTLKQGKSLQLKGFGSFKPVFRKSRTAFNPAARTKIKTEPKTVVKFSVGTALADAVKTVSRQKIAAANTKRKTK